MLFHFACSPLYPYVHVRARTHRTCMHWILYIISTTKTVCISDDYLDDEDFVSTDEEMDTPDRSVSKSSSVRAENSFDSLDSRDDHQVGRGCVAAGFDETVDLEWRLRDRCFFLLTLAWKIVFVVVVFPLLFFLSLCYYCYAFPYKSFNANIGKLAYCDIIVMHFPIKVSMLSQYSVTM